MKMKKCILFIILLLPILSKGQIISTMAGTGSAAFSGDNGPAIAAGLSNPTYGAFDNNGNYYFADATANRIRKISPLGVITTVAGNGTGAYTGDGSIATATGINRPHSVKLDTSGNLYIVQYTNNVVRKVNMSTGIITTIAGNGTGAFGGDSGPATAASIWDPQDVAIDKWGNVYIADMYNYRVRKVDMTGTITTVAGTGTMACGPDGGLATSTDIAFPTGLAVDDTGNLYIADASSFSCRVRKVNTAGIITTVAGNGGSTYVGDGIPATNAPITPVMIALDKFNNLFISDRYNHRAYKVDVMTGVLYNVAGNGIAGDGGDGGLATSASLYTPTGVALDACGNLYIPTIGDITIPGTGHRIRKVTFNPPTTPTITVTGVTSATIGATVTVNATVSGAGSGYSIKWFKNSTLFSTTTVPTTTYVKGVGTDIITARVVPASAYITCYDSVTSEGHSIVGVPVGIPLAPVGDFVIYPNPAHDAFVVSSGGGVLTSVSITNLLGQEVVYKACNTPTETIAICRMGCTL